MAYLTTADITDTIKGSFDLTNYLTLADAEIVNKARSYGLLETDIATPIDFCIKQWAVAWVLMRLCLDKTGASNPENIEGDKYFIKYNIYRDQNWYYAKKLTKEMFLGTVETQTDMTGMVGNIMRG